MKLLTLVVVFVAVAALGSVTIIYVANTIPHTTIIYVDSWVYPDNHSITQGGDVYTGETLRIYTQASDGEIASKDLRVNISIRPQGGSWTTLDDSYNSTLNYWYIDWKIPDNAATGLYDVKVDVGNGRGGSATSTDTGQINVVAMPKPS